MLSVIEASPQSTNEITSADSPQTEPELTDLDIGELMKIPVTTLSRRAEPWWESAAAIHVITQEDIQRSGATSIPEALRMAPGLNVARIDSSRWAISSRGFNDFFANKLLVLMDGRSVYTPLFSGVFWDVQDTLLEDIDRIEVIRGPGASLWGANAVNGIINIITKSSRETQGTLITAGAGSEEVGFGSVRYGGKISDEAYYKAYVKYSNRDDSPTLTGMEGADEWDIWRGGVRTDWLPGENNTFTIQGDAYSGSVGQEQLVFPPPTFFRVLQGRGRVAGANLLGSWKHEFSPDSDFILQIYYDRTEREDRVHKEVRNTGDLDFQHSFAVGERNRVMWGFGYRLTEDDLGDGKDGTGAIRFSTKRQSDQLFSTFIQDEITLVEDRLKVTAGSKFEHNDYTEFEWQPSGRLAWTPTGNHTVWGSVSRAVRTPARFEHTVDAWFVPPPARLIGNGEYESEEVLAYELGYRIQPLKKLSFDLAAFYNEYDNLRTVEPFGSAGPITLYKLENAMEGESYGIEVAGNWNVTKAWRITAGYTLLQMQLHSERPQDELLEGDSPQNQFHLRSYLDLPHRFQIDTALYYVDSLATRNVPSYTRWDVRLGWKPLQKHDLDLSLVVQNLLDPQHPEFGSGFLVLPHEIERSVYGKATWRF